MKLYLAAGQFVGTQADARKLDRLFATIEVPTDKEGLLDYLNRMTRVTPTVTISAPAPIVKPVKSDATQRDISIEEAIGAADHPRAIRLAEHIHGRLMELARR